MDSPIKRLPRRSASPPGLSASCSTRPAPNWKSDSARWSEGSERMNEALDELPDPLRQAVARLRQTEPDPASIDRALTLALNLEKKMRFRRLVRRFAGTAAAAAA